MALTTITNAMVSVNAIQGTLIADNAITAVHIATNAVSGTLVADNAITATHIAQNTITVTQIADDAIESAKIADGIITTNHLNKAMISSQTEVAVATGDFILLGDTSDSNNLKKAPISSILAGTLTTAAQTNITSLGTLTALTGGTGDLIWDTNTLVVDSSANKIYIGDTASHTDDFLQIETPASGGGHGIQLRRNDSNNDQQVGRILFGNNTDTDLAQIAVKTDGANDNAAILFSTQPDSGSLTERMRINHDGKTSWSAGGVGAVATQARDFTFYTEGSTNGVAINSNDHRIVFMGAAGSSGAGMDNGYFQLESAGTAKVVFNTNGSSYFTGGDVGIGTDSPSSKLTVSEAGDGNTPTMHVIDTSDTEVAWFEGNRAGDTGAFISLWHKPASAASTNRCGIKFQAPDAGNNKTSYAIMRMMIDSNAEGTEDGRLEFILNQDASLQETLTIKKDVLHYKGEGGGCYIRADNRADGHDTGFEIYQNGSRKWEIYNDDSHSNQLDFRPGGSTEVFCIRDDGRLRVGVAPDIAAWLAIQKSNAGVPVFYAKNTNADSLAIRAEVNSSASNNAIIEAVNSNGAVWKIRNDGDHQGSDTSIGSISDSRTKKDVASLTYDIAKFKQYRPVTFNWINPECHNNKSNNRGFIAQEVKAIDDFYTDKYESQGEDLSLVDSDGTAHSTKFGYKDAMYISVIKQLITSVQQLMV